jgi:cytochrome b involved in lipid metabolism
MKKIIVAFVFIILLSLTVWFVFFRTDQSTALVSPSSTPLSSVKTYTLAEIATHNTEQSCYVTIRGEVYDVTQWIPKHPGGPQRIINLCGTDATQAFETKHDDAPKPNAMLATFKIGELAK